MVVYLFVMFASRALTSGLRLMTKADFENLGDGELVCANILIEDF